MTVETLTAERLAGHLAEYSFIHQIAREVDFEKRLGEIKAPTLILWGKDDRVIPLTDGYRVQAGIPGSRLKIFPGGHTWKRSRPEVLAQVVRDFLLTPPPPSLQGRASIASEGMGSFVPVTRFCDRLRRVSFL